MTCRWTEFKIVSKQGGMEVARFEKVWGTSELPGGVAKLERRERKQDAPVTYAVLEYKFEK
jgi:hypothetical protein